MDNLLTLQDRLEIIKTTNQKHDLENKAYLSFSGGKDSTILHYLLDLALPNNQIPRVFINTGIEYNDIVSYVKELAQKDKRFVIINSGLPIKQILEKYGYPFKSKQHSHILNVFQNSGYCLTVMKYLGFSQNYCCPLTLRYQFVPDFNLKISDKCCTKLKKEPINEWLINNNRYITITGMRKSEGGFRAKIKGCILTDNNGNLKKFHPLLVIDDNWENWFIKTYKINLCKLYYPPFNFKRTGCKGCPFSLDLQDQLEIMEKYLPNERNQCEVIWKPIYDEYRRIGYRLLKDYKEN